VPLQRFVKHMHTNVDHRIWLLVAKRFHKSGYLTSYKCSNVPCSGNQTAAQRVLEELYLHVLFNPFVD
jgi:hypothetical protein